MELEAEMEEDERPKEPAVDREVEYAGPSAADYGPSLPITPPRKEGLIRFGLWAQTSRTSQSSLSQTSKPPVLAPSSAGSP